MSTVWRHRTSFMTRSVMQQKQMNFKTWQLQIFKIDRSTK